MSPQLVQIGELSQLIDLIESEFGSGTSFPCPYCGAGQDRFYLRTDEGGSYTFSGADRIRFVCRKMSRIKEAGGMPDHGPVISLQKVLSDRGIVVELTNSTTWDELATALEGAAGLSRSHTVKSEHLYSLSDVVEDYMTGAELWKKHTIFDDVTLRAFKLGSRMWRSRVPRLTIPIEIEQDKYILKARAIDPRDTLPQKYDAPGLVPVLFDTWMNRDGQVIGRSPVYTICEGEKSLMALWQAGAAPVGTTTAGSSVWKDEWTRTIIVRLDVESVVYIIGDDDDSGDTFVAAVRRSFERCLVDYPEVNVELRHYAWDQFGVAEDRSKTDPYDLVAQGTTWAEVRDRCVGDEIERAVKLGPATLYETFDLGELRGSGENSIEYQFDDFLSRYSRDFYVKKTLENDAAGTVLLEQSMPGVGKTAAAVRVIERRAMEYYEKQVAKDQERERLAAAAQKILDSGAELSQEEEKRLTRQAKAKPTSKVYAMFVGPFLASYNDLVRVRTRPDLWYNLEARTPSNCDYYDTQARIARRGYTVMGRLCRGACPFAEACAKKGYMQQFEEMKQYPIIFLRHPHLMMKDLMAQAKVVVVDEDASNEYLKRVALRADDFDSIDGLRDLLENDYDRDIMYAVFALRDALEHALLLSAQDGYDRSGADVFKLLDVSLRVTNYGVHDLVGVVNQIMESGVVSTFESRTPHQLMESETIEDAPSGHFATLLRLIAEEVYAHYHMLLINPDYKWNSRVNIVGKEFVFYPLTPFDIPMKTPVIALDATGSPVKYERAFGRDVLPRSRTVRDSSLTTTVFYGSSFSISTMRKRDKSSRAIMSDTASWASFEHELSAAVDDALKIIVELALKHSSLLVVTYKGMDDLLRGLLLQTGYADLIGRISFQHYWSLRGSNEFEDMQAVLLVGVPRPPLEDTARLLSALYYTEYADDPLDLRVGYVDRAFHSWGQLPMMSVPMFVDSRTHPLLDEIEAGEMLQCAARIRPYTNADKYVYVLSSRPAVPFVDRLISYRNVTSTFDIRTGAMDVTRSGVATKVQAVRDHLQCGEDRARSVVAYLKKGVLPNWEDDVILPLSEEGAEVNG